MEKTTLAELAKQYNAELKDALTLIFNELNKGQTQKLMKNDEVKALVEKYKIQHK